ncbi:hypothetical protein D1614_05795 [Maribellus luteus]|uniref:Tetratricopeptide repeat protein n=1 Tax=Maribellus luteus TaxID=2305463 RepID=A0A399T219_9BACT|nr:tetratricopeptide repeat protein [Maribellus luteus]RIJ49079.1 hypothetical protein D1614_05795 [Maribellus luteus]
MKREQFTKYLHNSALLNRESLEQLRILTDEFPWFQAGWMLYLKNLKKIDSPQFEEVLKKVAVMVPDRKQLYKFLNNEICFQPLEVSTDSAFLYKLENTASVEVQGNSLIDRFLNSGPSSFSRPNHRPQPPELAVAKDIMDKSVSENDELITETLANIYFQQKNYTKAIESFEKLSLKFPEKSVYFASRIKEIEVIKNNT